MASTAAPSAENEAMVLDAPSMLSMRLKALTKPTTHRTVRA
jgi:hypothetical protein